MREEIKRIDEMKRQRGLNEAARSTNLTGEQLFIRSCNECHPQGKLGMGPRLDDLQAKFPSDAQLRTFLRAGKGIMPGQPPEVMNDAELNALIVYVRELSVELQEANKSK